MSVRERRRLPVFEQVRAGRLRLTAAAQQLGLSYRQTRRAYGRFRRDGDAGLVHGLRGRPGNRRTDPAVRQRAVALYREHYGDFGATLASEHLARDHALAVDDQTLRRWLVAEGLWRRRRKGQAPRRRRERRACAGELVQIDGSHHDWFEGRRGPCVLMVMIDDATGLTEARFFEGETTHAAMTMLRRWTLRHGLPLELYPDRHGIYRVNTAAADEQEARTGKRPATQLGRALAELGARLTCAKSPQAKGRVERMNQTLQDRLVKALRLAGISDLEAANAYLEAAFLPDLNGRFAVEPACAADAHRTVGQAELDAALCVKARRVAGRDQCVSWQGQALQLLAGPGRPSLAGKAVEVRVSLEGAVGVWWQGRAVGHRVLERRPRPEAAQASLSERVAGHAPPGKPPANHPWRAAAVTRR